jgi:hypothetical protein
MSDNEERDKTEIIGLIDMFYQLISGDCIDKRDWKGLKNLFSQKASLTMIGNESNSGFISLNVQNYMHRLATYFETSNFWERGSCSQVAISNRIASVNSSYEASTEPDFLAIMKSGTNFIQLVKTEKQWKIVSMLWEDNPDNS